MGLQTALIIPVPEADPVVGPHRATLDRAAAWGIPAHVTILVPFVPATPEVISALRTLLAGFPAFESAFHDVGWFGDDVVWLAPAPAEPFRALTMAVWQRFPSAPPFEGAFDDVVPHLTIGHGAPRPTLAAAATAVTPHLPLTTKVSSVRLVEGETGRTPWRTVTEFPLGPPSPPSR